MRRCVCSRSGHGSGVIQEGPLYHPCCVECAALRGRTFTTRAAAEDLLRKHKREEHGR